MSTNTKYLGPALHTAVYYNDKTQFDKLIANSNNFNIRDNNSNNVVHIAILMDRQDMLKQLAEAGADLNVLNNIGESPLEIAFRSEKAATVKLLIEQGTDTVLMAKFKDGTTLLHNIVKTADKLELLEFALDAVAKTETQDRRGNTALHYALQLAHTNKELSKQYTKIAKTLIAKEMNPTVFNQQNLLRKPAYMIAVRSRNEEALSAMDAKLPGLSKITRALKHAILPKENKAPTKKTRKLGLGL